MPIAHIYLLEGRTKEQKAEAIGDRGFEPDP
jgi:phenylpyruvate tautomerase PptA (4-oxalocrotonate tautomerase family)